MTTRRTLLASAAAAPLLAAPLGSLAAPAAQSTKGTFVLVPGQWTGAFVWHTVAPILRAAGHDVYPVTCTGLGERSHLANAAIDLDTFVTDVVNVLEYEDLHDVTLVGHSFAGMVITGVAEVVPERLKQLVFLDALVPVNGENAYNTEFGSGEVYQEAVAADITGAMEAGMPGFVPVYTGIAEWVRGMAMDPAEAEWFIAKLAPHPQLTLLQPIQLDNPAAATLPRAFIYCTQDPLEFATRTAERVKSEPDWRLIEMEDNHIVNLNDPEGTADVLISLL